MNLEHHRDHDNATPGGARERPVTQPAGATSHPAASRRIARAVFLDCARLEDSRWRVTGGALPHVVTADGSECSCSDFLFHRSDCKHIGRVRLRLGDATMIAALCPIVPLPFRSRRAS